MSLSDKQVQALADAVATWQMQEVYYVLTTLDEEVAIILPQKLNRGKMLFFFIRYGTLVFIALQLSRDYQNYLVVSPMTCKVLFVFKDVVPAMVSSAAAPRDKMQSRSTAALALCLGALLQVKGLFLSGILVLSMGPRIVTLIFTIVSEIQYPAQTVSNLDTELGYPCYMPSTEQWLKLTISETGLDIRTYIHFATTAGLFLLAGATLIVRYKGHNGQLIRVLRRDGGLYYITLAGIRFGQAITRTPAVIAISQLDSSPGYVTLTIASYILIPTAAQRLMINLRKADYMGSRPIASKLLFAPHPPGLEDGESSDTDIHGFSEMGTEGCNGRRRASATGSLRSA
ncbi:hypothetical protein NMY22_g9040 [Coprinellus aureogranulatus]|nr:hypothetical protein NMY22_g9040 [Coprinellus aureogranulatus]